MKKIYQIQLKNVSKIFLLSDNGKYNFLKYESPILAFKVFTFTILASDFIFSKNGKKGYGLIESLPKSVKCGTNLSELYKLEKVSM